MKPCPSCGSLHLSTPDKPGDFVLCFMCLMAGPKGETPAHAIELWNALPRRGEVSPLRGSIYEIDGIAYRVNIVHDGLATVANIIWADLKGRVCGVAGGSYCNPKDMFDANFGERLAMKRACRIGNPFDFQLRELYSAWRRDQWESRDHVEAVCFSNEHKFQPSKFDLTLEVCVYCHATREIKTDEVPA